LVVFGDSSVREWSFDDLGKAGCLNVVVGVSLDLSVRLLDVVVDGVDGDRGLVEFDSSTESVDSNLPEVSADKDASGCVGVDRSDGDVLLNSDGLNRGETGRVARGQSVVSARASLTDGGDGFAFWSFEAQALSSRGAKVMRRLRLIGS